ncbi:hypothetical protein MTO96_020302 [Rhipicephalus appendiculatus]
MIQHRKKTSSEGLPCKPSHKETDRHHDHERADQAPEPLREPAAAASLRRSPRPTHLKIHRLGDLLTQLSEVDAAVEPLVPDEEAEENYARTIAYNDRIVTCVARLSQQTGSEGANAITAAEASRAPRNGHRRASGSKVKLPKLELQRFSGAATVWQPFWEQ